MIASSVLNSITFKNLTGTFPNTWNTLHNSRMQGTNKLIPYYQKFQKDHSTPIQFISDDPAGITLIAYIGLVEVERWTNAYTSHYGTINIRYFTNFVVILGSVYYDKKVWFKAIQGVNELTSEPIQIVDLTEDIKKGVVKYVKYTNLDRIESDLDDRFIDWSILPNDGNFLDMYINAQDFELNDTDENEVLEGSQSMTILSSAYYAGRVLKTSGIPDFMAAKLGMISSLDVFMVNDIQYIKKGEIEASALGGSTLYQVSLKLIQKNAIGINVDNLGISETVVTPPVAGTLMYVGSVSSVTPTEAEIKTMSSTAALKSNQLKNYTISNAHPCYAFPASYGYLASIIDNVGDEIISGFDVALMNFTTGGVSMSYRVYTLKLSTSVTNFNVNYKFTGSVIIPILNPPIALSASYPTAYSFTARWATVFSATGYYLTVLYAETRAAISTEYNNKNVGNVLEFNVTGLDSAVNYIYLVKAFNSSLTSDYSNEITIRTA